MGELFFRPTGGQRAEWVGKVQAGQPQSIEWEALPESVRHKLAVLAAEAMNRMSIEEIPKQLQPVVKFAPRKRAKVAATLLISTLASSPYFRGKVTDLLAERESDPSNVSEASDPGSTDPVAAATSALLRDKPSAVAWLALVAEQTADNAMRAERDAARAQVHRLEADLAQAKEALAKAQAAVTEVRAEREAEVQRLRGRLRTQGGKLREAQDAVARAQEEVTDSRRERELAALTHDLDRERRRVADERARADRAQASAEAAERAAREARSADEVRLALLVDTIDGAVTGLRQELFLARGTSDGRRPADAISDATSAPDYGTSVRDTAMLDQLLTIPGAHLIVDGYNLTLHAYPELPLADQRDRLVRQLSSLAARTNTEVTVVFDGADVISVPAAALRGVRVLFSKPGVSADDVIRSLVAAEPIGRQLIVATSDRAIVESVQRQGSSAVASAILAAALGQMR